MKPPRPVLLPAITPRRRAWRSTSVVPAAPPADQVLTRADAERRAQLMTMLELAQYLRYTGWDAPDEKTRKQAANSAYCFVRLHGIRRLKRGKSILVRTGDVDRYLETGASDLRERALRSVR